MGVTRPRQQPSTVQNTKKAKSNVNAYSTHLLNQMRKHESKIIKEMTRPQSNKSLLGKTVKADRREKSPMEKSADRKSKKQLSKNDRLTQSKSSFKLLSNSKEPLHKQRPIKTYANASSKATTPRNFEARKVSTLASAKETGIARYL